MLILVSIVFFLCNSPSDLFFIGYGCGLFQAVTPGTERRVRPLLRRRQHPVLRQQRRRVRPVLRQRQEVSIGIF